MLVIEVLIKSVVQAIPTYAIVLRNGVEDALNYLAPEGSHGLTYLEAAVYILFAKCFRCLGMGMRSPLDRSLNGR